MIFSVLFCVFSYSEYYIHTLSDDPLTSFLPEGYHSVQSEWSVGSFRSCRTCASRISHKLRR